jgi:glycerol-3-phosphate acyltransferase PlsY
MFRHAPPTLYDTLYAVREEQLLVASLAALFAVCGHLFPVWLKFKGGKGVATAVGAFALLSPRAVLVALGIFLLTLALARYVSLGSILGAIAFPISAYLLPPISTIRLDAGRHITLIAVTSTLVILKHHANIRRLIAGTEPKLGTKSNPPSNSLPVEKRA